MRPYMCSQRPWRRPLCLGVSILVIPCLLGPSADAETATPSELHCIALDEASDACPTEEERETQIRADGDYGESCEVWASRDAEVEIEGECCYMETVACDEESGCR